MDLDSRSTEQLHIDQTVSRTRLFARLLNETLDELARYGIDCIDVRAKRFQDPTFRDGRRVELILNFKTAPATP